MNKLNHNELFQTMRNWFYRVEIPVKQIFHMPAFGSLDPARIRQDQSSGPVVFDSSDKPSLDSGQKPFATTCGREALF